MSGKIALGAAAGLLIGAAGGYLTAQSQAKAEVEEARGYQVDFAEKNTALAMENMSLQRRAKTLENSTYDRQMIRQCMQTSSVLSSAIGNHLQGKVLSSIERGTLMQHMSTALVAVQGKSTQSAMLTLLDEHAKIDEECLDRARIKVAE